jgi:hypothetical protein
MKQDLWYTTMIFTYTHTHQRERKREIKREGSFGIQPAKTCTDSQAQQLYNSPLSHMPNFAILAYQRPHPRSNFLLLSSFKTSPYDIFRLCPSLFCSFNLNQITISSMNSLVFIAHHQTILDESPESHKKK